MKSVFSVCLKFCWTNYKLQGRKRDITRYGVGLWKHDSSGPLTCLKLLKSEKPATCTWHYCTASDSAFAFLEWVFFVEYWGFPVFLHVSIVVAAFSLLEYISLYEKCILLVWANVVSRYWWSDWFFFHPAFIIQLLHIFCRFLSVHSAHILSHGQVEHEFWWGFESQVSLSLSLCQRTWQVVISAFLCLLLSIFHCCAPQLLQGSFSCAI